MNFGEKSYASGIPSESWSSRNQSPLVAEESLSHKLGCTLISFTDNKENSSSNLVLSLFHVLWLMNVFDYIFDILFI